MPTLDEVYRKFGEVAEAAQLLETELGTSLLLIRAVEDGLVCQPNQDRAADILGAINRKSLGQILKHLNGKIESLDKLEVVLWDALQERKQLWLRELARFNRVLGELFPGSLNREPPLSQRVRSSGLPSGNRR